MTGLIKFKKGKLKGVIIAKISEQEMGNGESKMRCTVTKLDFVKMATGQTKGEGAYEIRPQVRVRAEMKSQLGNSEAQDKF